MPEPSSTASSPAPSRPATSATAAEPAAAEPAVPEPAAPEPAAPEPGAAGGGPVAGNGAADELAGGIGRRLAAHRSRRGIRVAELARVVGVTPSLISQIERGTSRPSVSTLFALAQALNVPVDAFFRESPAGEPVPRGGAGGGKGGREAGQQTGHEAGHEAGAGEAGGRYLVRRENRATIDIEGGVRWERLTRNTLDHLDFFELVYEPGAESHPRQYTHPGTEMVLMISGCLEITVGFERYRLEPGDSIDFPSSMPHRYLNPGTETARAVTVIFYDCPGPPGSAPQPAGRADLP
ncbi:MAG: helix-turn-helix transcriptional regulator [Actinobacteria bacterium]|nr:helix-turn-helix transcriptional regulator [Actinomycetota bacterium]